MCPATDEQMKCDRSRHGMLFSHKKERRADTFITTRMDLENMDGE